MAQRHSVSGQNGVRPKKARLTNGREPRWRFPLTLRHDEINHAHNLPSFCLRHPGGAGIICILSILGQHALPQPFAGILGCHHLH